MTRSGAIGTFVAFITLILMLNPIVAGLVALSTGEVSLR